MKVETIIKELDLEFPQTFAMDWDNPGLQVGSSQKEVKKVLVALDATNEVIEECIAWHADLLLTHHPLLLSGIRQINDGSMHGRKVLMLAEHGIALQLPALRSYPENRFSGKVVLMPPASHDNGLHQASSPGT